MSSVRCSLSHRAWLGLFAILAPFLQALPASCEAHELLPETLLEYIRTNPGATVKEMEALFSHNAYRFTVLGVEHILDGWDHILFILSVVLVFTSLRSLLKLVTLFTVAHSITLLLAGGNLLTLSSRIVEPMIALSIAYVAVTSVFLGKHRFFRMQHSKGATIFLFGLFHGLGFAGLLRDLEIPGDMFLSSLLFFNVGIELGQMMILSLVVPFVLLLRRLPGNRRILQCIALLLAACALFWLLQRLHLQASA